MWSRGSWLGDPWFPHMLLHSVDGMAMWCLCFCILSFLFLPTTGRPISARLLFLMFWGPKKGLFFVILFCSNFHSLEALKACREACPDVFCSNFMVLRHWSSRLALRPASNFVSSYNFLGLLQFHSLEACLEAVPLRQLRLKILARQHRHQLQRRPAHAKPDFNWLSGPRNGTWKRTCGFSCLRSLAPMRRLQCSTTHATFTNPSLLRYSVVCFNSITQCNWHDIETMAE